MKIKKIIYWLLVLIAGITIFMVIKTYVYPFEKHNVKEYTSSIDWQISEKSLKRLAGGIRIPTVSAQVYENTFFEPFDRFKRYLAESYPLVYANTDTLIINNYGLVFRWAGTNDKVLPLLFLAHYDVVPVAGHDGSYDSEEVVFRPDDEPVPAPEQAQVKWDYPPFSGAVANGRIYGRGTLDDKGSLFAILEAMEALIEEEFIPERDIWLAFGHDEEVSGIQGAGNIAAYFAERGLRFEAAYDEGGIITAPGIGGINSSLALIGTAEKGFLSLRIKVRGRGGHSSMPPAKSSLVLAAEIIEKLNDNQMPLRLIPPVSSFLDKVGGGMGFLPRTAIANIWALEGVLLGVFSGNPATNALVRTTTAITMAKGSDASNVISSMAEITVNFRLLPGDPVSAVLDHVEKLCDGYDTDIEIISARDASNISPSDTDSFMAIGEAVSKLYPSSIITPYITIAGTDAYKYQSLSDNIYRFMPVYLNDSEQNTMHNENEHITIDNYAKMISYYKMMLSRKYK